MKKGLLFTALLLGAGALSSAQYVDFDAIQNWAGEGENKAALVIDFQDGLDSRAYVWGYRWNGTASGEDMIRAIAAASKSLTVMVQYTGAMGSTLNGIGLSADRSLTEFLDYDFDRAAIGGEVSFGYFEPNPSMGQETAPGDAAYTMCRDAIERSRQTGIIEHPLNAFAYGYPAYDYDYWQLQDGYKDSYDYRWRSGWYEGYWSYWVGSDNDYDTMSYSGLGMSSAMLTNGCVNAWKFVSLGGYGDAGGDLATELDYEIADYGEAMTEPAPVVQPVDQNKVGFWVGEGEKAATVVFQFNDDKGPENLVYGYRWSGGWDDALSDVLNNIANADPRMTLTRDASGMTVTYDSDDDGQINNSDHQAKEGDVWDLYVKRIVDPGFCKVPNSRFLNPNAVLVVSRRSDSAKEKAPGDKFPYLLYRPAVSETPSITLPETIDYALSDEALCIPAFIQKGSAAKVGTTATWTLDNALKAVMTIKKGDNIGVGKATFKSFAPTKGNVSLKISIGSSSVQSNECELSLYAPVRPITSMHYESEYLDARFTEKISNKIVYEPADATYTKISYAGSDGTIASVVSSTGVATTKTKAGQAVVTATYDYDKSVTASYTLDCYLHSAVENVTFDCADENGVITLTPKEMVGLFPPRVEPADADVQDFDIKLTGNGSGKADYIATMYQVNMWDADNVRTRPYELSGHRIGECTLTVTSKDGTGYARDFTVRVVEPEREPAIDYTEGTLMLNEEWFTHTNGGLNYYTPDYDVVYQAYERENPGMSFGATSQYGVIYDNKLLVCSKQAVDNGDPLPGGGRFVVADASTLKRIGSIDNLMFGEETKSNDGRAVCGAGTGRAYVGTNSGIYIVDTDNVEVIGKITGSDPDGEAADLYNGQIGDMLLAGEYVFALRQSTGLYIIDINTDNIVKFIRDASVQGLTQSSDGSVWYATVADGHSRFVAIDPESLEETASVDVPAELGTVACGWGAWRSTQFTAARSIPAIFFAPGSSITNGGAGVYYRYDIGSEPASFTKLIDIKEFDGVTPGLKQGAYGTIRYDDRSGELIVGTTESKASGHYRYNWTHFVDGATGEIRRSIQLRPYYWFQAHAIFPDKYEPVFDLAQRNDLILDDGEKVFDLTGAVSDEDNIDRNIRLSLTDLTQIFDEADLNGAEQAMDVKLEGKNLRVTPYAKGSATFNLVAESNGRRTVYPMEMVVSGGSGISSVDASGVSVEVNGRRVIVRGCSGRQFTLYDMTGRGRFSFVADADPFIMNLGLEPGAYILRGGKVSVKMILK